MDSDIIIEHKASSQALAQPDINEIIKAAVTTALGEIPYLGSVVSAFVGLFWPESGMSAWDQVREYVERMIDQKIDQLVFGNLKQVLQGLGDLLRLYIAIVHLKPPQYDALKTHFFQINGHFVAAAPEFQNPSHEWTLAPLFAVFAQMHVSLLRDCVLHGREWGLSDQVYGVYADLTRRTISKYKRYFDTVKTHKRDEHKATQPSSPGRHNTDIFNHWSPLNQQMIVLLDDYELLVDYLNPFTHPGQVTTRIPFKDVFSLAYGTADDWDYAAVAVNRYAGVTSHYETPLAQFEEINIELFNYGPRVVNVTHAPRTGPLAGQSGSRLDKYGVIAAPISGRETKKVTFQVPDNRGFTVQKARVRVGSIPLNLFLIMYDGREIWMWEKHPIAGGTSHTVEVPGRMLSTLNMWTHSEFYDKNLGCIIFGFSYDHKYTPTDVSDLLYITGSDQRNEDQGVDSDNPLQQERKAFWDFITETLPTELRTPDSDE